MIRITRVAPPIAFLLALAPAAPAGAQEPTAEAPAASADEAELGAEGRETGEVESAEEKDPRGRLADRIKSVQRKAFLKKKRLELFPQFALDLNDPFFQHLIVGGALAYHFADAFALEVRGGAVFASLEQSAIRFVRQETGSLLENPPEFRYHADVDFLWAPIFGKVSLLGEGIVHFDTYLTAGPGIFGTDAGLNPSINIGIGQRYFLTDWLVARIELRDYIFLEKRNGEADLQNLLILGFAISGFFPTSFSYEFQ